MKLLFFVLFTLYLVHTECNSTTIWFPNTLYTTVANKTSEFTKFVKQYGLGLRDRIASYFDTNRTEEEPDPEVIQARYKRKFRDYVMAAKLDDVYNKVPETTTTKASKFLNSSKDDPTITMTTPQIISYFGYPAESHTVITEDGYFLTIHRIPYRNQTIKEDPRKTVLLHHGLVGSSADWVISGPEKGLAFILSNVGYDVWLANVRGNTYSRAHVSRPVDSFEFWNFTFHEISQYDLPAVIDYIMEVKGWNIKINYIGHSMGTTVLFALLSTKTQYNKVLRAGYALAPVAYMSDIKSPIKVLAKFVNNIEYLMKLLGAYEFLPQSSVLKWLSKHACEMNHYEEAICENSIFVLCGYDEKQFNKTLLPRILSHNPAGASTKTLIHYAQMIHNNGRFQQFDYGPRGNMLQYGSVTPPEYPVFQITLPIALLSSENDWLSSDTDVTHLFVQLANPIEHFIVSLKEFNHIDFLWGIDAPQLVYSKLLQLLADSVASNMYYNFDVMNTIDNYI